MRNQIVTPNFARAGAAAAGAAALIGFSAVSASATTLTFDFGLIGANGGSVCTHNCVLPTAAEKTFTTGGVTVGAIGFNAGGGIAYVTQKPGAYAANGGETGLGESDTRPEPSDSDYEVTRSTWLLIDNAQAFGDGYKSATFSIESMQKGEGAKVYAYTGGLGALNLSRLSLLATISNPATGGVTQTIDVPNNSLYLVVQAFKPEGGSSAADIVVAQEVLNTAAAPGVPEPATWAMILVGFGAMGAILRRRSKMAAAA
jgi:hypothetical protein